MKNIVFLIIAMVNTCAVYPQAPAIEWEKTYGGPLTEFGYSIEPCDDGGYFLCGWTRANGVDVSGFHGTKDIWVVKTDSVGTLVWQSCLGGINYEESYHGQQCPDGGYIICGFSDSDSGQVGANHGLQDCWIVKLDSAGSLQWERSLGGSMNDLANSIIPTNDGGYAFTGFAGSSSGDVSGNHGNGDCWVVKLDSAGNFQWQNCLGGSNPDNGWKINQTADGGYIVGATSSSIDGNVVGNHGGGDIWIIRLNASGSIIWQKCLGGSGSDIMRDMRITSDAGFVIGGYSNSVDGDVSLNQGAYDYWVVKLDSSGTLISEKTFGGPGNDYGQSVRQVLDGGYIVAGYTNSVGGDVSINHGFNDYWIIRLDQNFNLLWQKSLGGSSFDFGTSVLQSSDDGFVVFGYSSSLDGDITVHNGSTQESDFWMVKLLPESTVSVRDLNGVEQNEFSLYPNPVADRLIIEQRKSMIFIDAIYNIYGENCFYPSMLTVNGSQIILELSSIASGFYFARLKDSKGQFYFSKFYKE